MTFHKMPVVFINHIKVLVANDNASTLWSGDYDSIAAAIFESKSQGNRCYRVDIVCYAVLDVIGLKFLRDTNYK